MSVRYARGHAAGNAARALTRLRGRQLGLSLIEVMIAVVTMAVGTLAVAGMQASGLRASLGASHRAQAAFLAQDIIERIRGNPGELLNYGIDFGDPPPSGSSVIDRDKALWLAAVARLPGGSGAVEIDDAANLVRVVVQFDNSRAGGSTTEQFMLTSRIRTN